GKMAGGGRCGQRGSLPGFVPDLAQGIEFARGFLVDGTFERYQALPPGHGFSAVVAPCRGRGFAAWGNFSGSCRPGAKARVSERGRAVHARPPPCRSQQVHVWPLGRRRTRRRFFVFEGTGAIDRGHWVSGGDRWTCAVVMLTRPLAECTGRVRRVLGVFG